MTKFLLGISALLSTAWNTVPFLCIVAGTCFGIWPYLLMRAKISGVVALTALATVQFIMLFLASGKKLSQWSEAAWPWIIGAGIVSSLGMLSFLRIGAILPEKDCGGPYGAATMIQVIVFITFNLVQNSGLTPTRILGYILVAGGVYGTYLLYASPVPVPATITHQESLVGHE